MVQHKPRDTGPSPLGVRENKRDVRLVIRDVRNHEGETDDALPVEYNAAEIWVLQAFGHCEKKRKENILRVYEIIAGLLMGRSSLNTIESYTYLNFYIKYIMMMHKKQLRVFEAPKVSKVHVFTINIHIFVPLYQIPKML